jgi:hypothetical protein
MTSKLSGLKRLSALYGKVEQIRSLQLRAAAIAVAEIERSIVGYAHGERQESVVGRMALESGDRAGWSASAVQAALAETRLDQLDALLDEREAAREQAAAVHRASHQRSEQMDGLVECAASDAAILHDRRAQAESDDRYLSRRAWLGARAVAQADELDKVDEKPHTKP